MSSKNVLVRFAEKFKGKPRLFFAPGRINMIGEHVDYNDGFVMPAAVDKGIWYAVAPNNTETLNFHSYDQQEDYSVSLYDVRPMEGWRNYVLGPVDQIQKKNLPITGFDCVFGGNLPVGAGMSSSAAVECGLLTALNEIYNLQLSRIDIALMGQKAEHTFPGVMCGIMDQFANMMGKKDHVILLDTRSLDYKYFPAHFQDYSIILINSKVHHSLASGEYNVRRKQCQEGLSILGKLLNVTSFRDIKSADVESNKDALNGDVYKRCLYVTQEIERTQKAAAHLEKDEVHEFGNLMFETHEGLSKLYDVSCEELDFLVEQAKRTPSIIGSRLMGGGFGGCTINLIKKSDWPHVTQEIVAAYKKQFDIDAEVYEVATGDGTYEVTDISGDELTI